MLHRWILVAWNTFPVTASCVIQKRCTSNNSDTSEGDMPHRSALENSNSGFSEDEGSMAKMNVKSMEKMKVKNGMCKFTLYTYVMGFKTCCTNKLIVLDS